MSTWDWRIEDKKEKKTLASGFFRLHDYIATAELEMFAAAWCEYFSTVALLFFVNLAVLAIFA